MNSAYKDFITILGAFKETKRDVQKQGYKPNAPKRTSLVCVKPSAAHCHGVLCQDQREIDLAYCFVSSL